MNNRNSEKEYIINKIQGMNLFKSQNIIFSEIHYTKDKVLNPYPENFGLGAYKDENLQIKITFTYSTYMEVHQNKFSLEIFRMDKVENFRLWKFLNKNYQENVINKMSLNYYEGNFKQKVDCFIIFFEELIETSIIKDIILKNYWTSEYHYDMWENVK